MGILKMTKIKNNINNVIAIFQEKIFNLIFFSIYLNRTLNRHRWID